MDEPRWPWLIDRRDAHGILEGHPQHDPCSLYVPESALKRMTKFNRQVHARCCSQNRTLYCGSRQACLWSIGSDAVNVGCTSYPIARITCVFENFKNSHAKASWVRGSYIAQHEAFPSPYLILNQHQVHPHLCFCAVLDNQERLL